MGDAPAGTNLSTPASVAACQTDVFELWLGLILPSVVITLGLLGNALCLLVLGRDQYPGPTFYSLRFLAASDTWLLVSALISQVVPMGCYTHARADGLCYYGEALTIYAWPVVNMAQLTTTWLTMLISAERYVAICWPLHARRICTLRKIRAITLFIVLGAVVYNIPRFFEFITTEGAACGGARKLRLQATAMRGQTAYRYLYNTVLQCLLQFALPMVSLAFLNLSVVRVMTSARRDWRALNRKRRRELRAGVIPLVVVLTFLAVSTQSLTAFILDAVHLDLTLGGWLQRYTAVVNLLVITNSAINFFIFYMFGSRFRLLLTRTVSCTPPHTVGLRRQGAQHTHRGRAPKQTVVPFLGETDPRRPSQTRPESDFLQNLLSVPQGHASRRTSAAWSEYSDNSDDTVPRYAINFGLITALQPTIAPDILLRDRA